MNRQEDKLGYSINSCVASDFYESPNDNDGGTGNNRWRDRAVSVNDNPLRVNKAEKIRQKLVSNNLSEEELKIKNELEIEIENDLEEEIKEEIYRLAFKLHRLYQNRKKRENEQGGMQESIEKTISEVNVSIKMEGGTRIEIKEIKKKEKESSINNRPRSSRSENNGGFQRMTVCSDGIKKFDWRNSLRAGRLQNKGKRVIEWRW